MTALDTAGGCFHCGLPVPPGADYRVEVQGQPREMCCPGCQAVATAIVDNGLEEFYAHRTAPSTRPDELVPEQLQRLALYDQPSLQQSFVEVAEGDQKSASLILEGITCAACVWLNERHVRALPGVLEFGVNYSTHRARVRWDDSRVHLSDILKAIADIGYVAHPFDTGRQEAIFRREKSRALRKLAIAGLAAMQVMMLAVALYAGDYSGMDPTMATFMRWVSALLTLPVVFYSATDIFAGAWRDLRTRRLSMDVPVSIAIGGAFAASMGVLVTGGHEVYFDSVCMFAFFLLSSRYLEMGARHRAGEAAEALVKLLPASTTRLREDGSEEAVAVVDLRPGDRVRVRPGETVPADGEVLEGVSSVDESLLTGESLPRPRGTGDPLIGGSVNVESPLTLRVDKVGEDTMVSAIVRLLDRAQTEKPHLAQLADRVAGWFVAGLLVIASATAVIWLLIDPLRAFPVTLSLLVVTCPCALSLATPTAITAASGALTKLGLLTTRGRALETLARATHVIFDKTGTLTLGQLRLTQIEPLGRLDAAQAHALAAALEQGSEHPVARVIVEGAPEGAHASEVVNRPGQGVEGRIAGRRYRLGTPDFAAWGRTDALPAPHAVTTTQVVLADEDGPLARFEFADTLRTDAAAAVQALRERGLEVVILSGDAEGAVRHVADALGIDAAHWGLRPDDKLAHVRALQAAGARVMMIGDGVNDAPVLAGADVSVAMGSGAQLAHASADMVMLSERLDTLVQGTRMAVRTRQIIRQNLTWALTYNLTAVPLAASGVVAPWMAAIGMSASSLVVVTNALRLRET